jgi:hypothetical protein
MLTVLRGPVVFEAGLEFFLFSSSNPNAPHGAHS